MGRAVGPTLEGRCQALGAIGLGEDGAMARCFASSLQIYYCSALASWTGRRKEGGQGRAGRLSTTVVALGGRLIHLLLHGVPTYSVHDHTNETLDEPSRAFVCAPQVLSSGHPFTFSRTKVSTS